MPSKNRQREYERRRHEKWLARQEEIRARRRRRWVAVAVAVGLIALVVAIVLVIGATRSDDPPEDPQTIGEPTADPPDPALAEGRTWTAVMQTSEGDITLELDGAAAPQAVASFVTLADGGLFDGTSCHRLTTQGIFVLQCGDPTGTGAGGPDYRFGPIENAPADDLYPAGTLAMARVGGDGSSMGSQFFLVYDDSTIPADEAGGYTVFGRIVDGMDVLQQVADAGVAEGAGETPVIQVTIEGIEAQ